MRILLDTHTFLWAASSVGRLSLDARALIEDTDNVRFISMARLWEISIKFGLGKLTLPQTVEKFVPSQLDTLDVSVLPIDLPHVLRVATLPLHHRDPFDRLIVAQSLIEKLPLISADNALDAYGITRLW